MKPGKGNSPKGTLHLDMFAVLFNVNSEQHILTVIGIDELNGLIGDDAVVATKRISFINAEHDYNMLVLSAVKAANSSYICALDKKISVAFDGDIGAVKDLLD